MAVAEGVGEEPPGLARQRRPRFRRSEATGGDMDGDGGSSRERGPPCEYVLALPAMSSLAVVASHLDAAVPRKPRTYLARAVPMGWWAFRLPVLPPPPPPLPPPLQAATEEEARRTWSPPRVVVAPPPDPAAAAAPAPAKKRPKRARRCLNCDAIETPQWRSGPMGKSTLCNACGVRLRAVGTLVEHRPAARTMAEPLPRPESPESLPDSPIWTPNHKSSSPDIYLVRKTPRPVRPPIKKQQPSPSPAPAAAPAPAPKTKTKTKTKTKKQKKKSCVHCGSTETPQWREGPMGRGTLCNACGVRYRQGRLLPEYRPKGSPTFSPSEHASNHRQVLELRRQHRQNNRCPPPPPPPPPPPTTMVDSSVAQPIHDEQQPVDPPQEKPIDLPPQEEPVDVPVAAGGGGGGGDATSSLDGLLLDGPSAPLIVDGDDFLVT